MRTRTILRLAVVVLLAGGLGTWGILKYRWRVPRRFSVVTRHVLYRSGQPDGEQLAALVKRYHIRTVINLRRPEENAEDPAVRSEAEAARRLGVRLVQRSKGGSVDLQTVQELLPIVENPSAQPVLVHCKYGKVRTSLFVAGYRMSHCGWTARKAMAEAKHLDVIHKDDRSWPQFMKFVTQFARDGMPGVEPEVPEKMGREVQDSSAS